MKLKIYAHLTVLFQMTAFIFLINYILFNHLITFSMLLLISFVISEIILRLFVQIRVVPSEES